jgi:glycerophosphoryl diester phosphodiesterase
MKIGRRSLLFGAAITIGAQQEPLRLIAHRGGVVGAKRAENSRASLSEALERGYWMIEVDIWRTRDGHPMLHHDATFARYYSDDRRVAELSWEEIRGLRASTDGSAPIDFEQACAIVSGKARLMLDVKGGAHPDEFYARIGECLTRHGLLRDTFTLGADRMKPRFWGKIWMSTDRKGLRAAAERGEPVDRHYFLFELGRVLDAEAVALCRAKGVTPVAAINTFRYHEEGVDDRKGAERDVRKLLALGVRHFQIDSVYEDLFPRAGRDAEQVLGKE